MRRRCCAGSTCSLRFHKLGAGDQPSCDVIAGLSIPLRYIPFYISFNLATILSLNHFSADYMFASYA